VEPSIAGLILLGTLLLLGAALRASVTVGLFASLPFGSTAIVTLSALGGSSPQVWTAFTLLLLGSVALRRDFLTDLGIIFSHYGTALVVAALVVYSVVSAVFFPRLFMGQTTAFVAMPGIGVLERPLAPVPRQHHADWLFHPGSHDVPCSDDPACSWRKGGGCST
jgi:hypothetical protein